MIGSPSVIQANGSVATLPRLFIRGTGHDEDELEAMLAANPSFFDSLAQPIAGKVAAFRQTTLSRPGKSAIHPDIIFLTDVGELLVVEVKLHDNPELVNREVIAQAVEYAACLRRLDATGLANLLLGARSKPSTAKGPSLEHLLASLFPHVLDVMDLHERVMGNLQRSEIGIVVACDGVPPGLREVVNDVTKVAAGAFSLTVLELTCYGTPEAMTVVPVTRLHTEVIQRIEVVVTGTEINVRATPIEDVERARASPKGERRQWDWPTLSEKLQQTGGARAVAGAKFIADWFEQNAVPVYFMENVGGSFIPVFVDGHGAPLPFSVQADGAKLAVQLRISSFPKFSDPAFLAEFAKRLNALPGVEVTPERLATGMPSVPLAVLADEPGQRSAKSLFEWLASEFKGWRPSKGSA